MLAAAVIGSGLYFLVAGDDGTVPEAAAPVAAPQAQVLVPAPMPSAAPGAEAVAPAEALGRDAAAAQDKMQQDVDREGREMPAAPADMGMIDKEGIARDAEEAAKKAGKTP